MVAISGITVFKFFIWAGKSSDKWSENFYCGT